MYCIVYCTFYFIRPFKSAAKRQAAFSVTYKSWSLSNGSFDPFKLYTGFVLDHILFW